MLKHVLKACLLTECGNVHKAVDNRKSQLHATHCCAHITREHVRLRNYCSSGNAACL